MTAPDALPREYHDALHALRVEHDRELVALQQQLPMPPGVYLHLEAGIKARLNANIARLNAEYERGEK